MLIMLGFPLLPGVFFGSLLFDLLAHPLTAYGTGLALALLGAALLFYAKLPFYQAHIYFSFGPAALPVSRRKFYYGGMTLAVIGCAFMALAVI